MSMLYDEQLEFLTAKLSFFKALYTPCQNIRVSGCFNNFHLQVLYDWYICALGFWKFELRGSDRLSQEQYFNRPTAFVGRGRT